uniref:GMC family oxidoreductase N-terminal domain-containing protein n=1 Tax=Bradyrhizobium japonicum TaxID=375 RepID=UPI0024BFF2E4|nr:GMC family oxidoreductase N-terminal domain-containing protein [Bradyrhizobium japonicum]
MGGSSTINGQIAIRAVPDDIDRWAAAGCTGWSWDEMPPYFCKLETDKNFPNEPYHGDRGHPRVSSSGPRLGQRRPGATLVRAHPRLWLGGGS